MKNFESQLYFHMNKFGMSARCLAIKMTEEGTEKISPQTINNWKNGKNKPKNIERVLLCARIFKLNKIEEKLFIESAGFSYETHLIKPTSNEKIFIQSLFDHFETSYPSPIFLLKQGNYNNLSTDLIIEEAEQLGLTNHFHSVSLPYCGDDYFSTLANELNLKSPVHNAAEFEIQLRQQVEQNQPYYLLINAIENTKAEDERGQFINIMRNLNNGRSTSLFLILCGGKKLQSFAYSNGNYSHLSTAKQIYWPEKTIENIHLEQQQNYPNQSLDDKIASYILKLSGGHPDLITLCFQCLQNKIDFSEKDLEVFLNKKNNLSHTFSDLFKNLSDKDHQRLIHWLEHLAIKPFRSLSMSPLLNNLYWKNLLINQEGTLQWRCEIIRSAAKEALSEL